MSTPIEALAQEYITGNPRIYTVGRGSVAQEAFLAGAKAASGRVAELEDELKIMRGADRDNVLMFGIMQAYAEMKTAYESAIAILLESVDCRGDEDCDHCVAVSTLTEQQALLTKAIDSNQALSGAGKGEV